MEIRIDDSGPFVSAALAGEFGADDVEAFKEILHGYATGEGAALAIDTSELSVMDSSGLSALIDLVTRGRLSRARVVLVAPSAFVAGILSVTRLDTWFEICQSLDDVGPALASLR